jgi:hypothetical protein
MKFLLVSLLPELLKLWLVRGGKIAGGLITARFSVVRALG